MASLVSAWNVEPPLSIGLFGEWGSGKSFFMQKMKERVRQIASEARKSQRGQKDFGYYKNIVQVEFNAWHYVEGNLWASLVEHIFSNLRLEGIGEENVDSEEYIRARLEKLLTEVKDKSAEAVRREQKAEELRLKRRRSRRRRRRKQSTWRGKHWKRWNVRKRRREKARAQRKMRWRNRGRRMKPK